MNDIYFSSKKLNKNNKDFSLFQGNAMGNSICTGKIQKFAISFVRCYELDSRAVGIVSMVSTPFVFKSEANS